LQLIGKLLKELAGYGGFYLQLMVDDL